MTHDASHCKTQQQSIIFQNLITDLLLSSFFEEHFSLLALSVPFIILNSCSRMKYLL